MLKRFPVYVLIVSLLWIGHACSSSSSQDPAGDGAKDPAPAAPIPAVEAVQAKYGNLPLVQRVSGTVRAQNQVEIHPELSAPIVKVYVQNGDAVKKGQLLVLLRQDEYKKQVEAAEAQLQLEKARVEQARAAVAQVQAQYSRTLKLSKRKMTSALEVETQKAQLLGAKANLKVAQAQESQAKADLQQAELELGRTEIRAPVAGYIGSRDAEVGMQVNPSSQLMELGSLDHVKVRIDLTEEMAGYVAPGQHVTIRAGDSISIQPITARISRISPFLDPRTHLTVAEIDIPNPKHELKPGMFVSVDIFYGESRQATLIPNSAIFQNPITGETGIYVAGSLGNEVKTVDSVNQGDGSMLTAPTPVTFRTIHIVARGQMMTAIDGLKSGSWVVVVGQNQLVNNTHAKVRPINWSRISSLQKLQDDDLVRALLRDSGGNRSVVPKDSTHTSSL